MPESRDNQAFLTPDLSLALDAIRLLSALVVLVGHTHQLGIYQGPWPFHGSIEHDAVIVFFVLSGLVIAASARQRETSLSSFAVARFARIVPVAWLAILFGLVACLAGKAFGTHPVTMPWQNAAISLKAIALPAIFLSETPYGAGPVWNPPFWSLADEVIYYALFGVVCYTRGWRRALSLIGLLLIAWPRALLLLPIWLMGATLAVWRPVWKENLLRSTGLLMLGLGLAYAGHHYAEAVRQTVLGQSGELLRFSQYFPTDILMGAGIALSFIAMRDFARLARLLLIAAGKPIAAGARASFPLYLFHYPALALQAAFGLVTRSILVMAGELLVLTVVALAIGNLAERWRIALRSKLTKAELAKIR